MTNNTDPINKPREITSHRINPANDTIEITVTDQPGAGGANHRYELNGIDFQRNNSFFPLIHGLTSPNGTFAVVFQNGPIPEKGVNGVTQEALLAIVEDRLASFQAGPFGCEENARALSAVRDALHWLHYRTLKRMARGVEGTHSK